MLFFFFFNDTATTEIYTLSLHDALPICRAGATARRPRPASAAACGRRAARPVRRRRPPVPARRTANSLGTTLLAVPETVPAAMTHPIADHDSHRAAGDSPVHEDRPTLHRRR